MNTTNLQKINEISSVKARNILRGVIGKKNISEAKKSLNRIKRECSERDYKVASEIIRAQSIFESNPLGRHFNKSFPSVMDNEIKFSISEIEKTIKYNKAIILKLLMFYGELLVQLAKKDYLTALNSISSIVKNGGVSVFLLRCLYFIRNHNSNDLRIIKKLTTLFLS